MIEPFGSNLGYFPEIMLTPRCLHRVQHRRDIQQSEQIGFPWSRPPPSLLLFLETKRVEGRMNGKKRRRRKEEEKGGEKKCRAAIEKDEIYLPVCTRASVDSISREVLYVSKPCNDSVITVKNTGTYIRTHRGIYRVSCTIFPCKSKNKI